jgi:hypothetical protein
MFSWLRRSTPPVPAVVDSRVEPAISTPTDDIPLDFSEHPRYPPFDQGVPLIAPAKIVASQSELLEKVQRSSGVSTEEFQLRYQPAIERLAAYVHLLPATAGEFHRGAGGLFRLSLEIAFHSLQTAHGHLFPVIGGTENEYHMRPRWAYATFLAGLLSQVYRPINTMVVVDGANQQWAPLLQPLYDWARQLNASRYFIRFVEAKQNPAFQATASYVVNHILTPDMLVYLGAKNTQIVPMMTATIAGHDSRGGENPIARIVFPTATRVMQADAKRSLSHYGNYSLGMHLEPHLIDAMRRLIKCGTWAVNAPGGPVWAGVDGLFIDWSGGARDIVQLLSHDHFGGVPQDPDTIADILLEAGALQRGPGRERYWTIQLPTGELVEGAVRVSDPVLVLPAHVSPDEFARVRLLLPDGRDRKNSPPPRTTPVRQEQDELPLPPVGGDERVLSSSGVPEADVVAVLPSQPGPKTHQSASSVPVTNSSDGVVPVAAAQSQRPQESNGEAHDRMPPPHFLGALSAESAFLLRSILKAVQEKTLKGPVAIFPEGFGISDVEIASHGGKNLEFLNELASRNWLWVDRTKPMRKLHPRAYADGEGRFLILKPEIASALGFPVDGAGL